MIWTLTDTNAPASGVQSSGDNIAIISGTFVANAQIQVLDSNGNWQRVEDFAAPSVRKLSTGIPVFLRPILTSYTSGTVVVEIR